MLITNIQDIIWNIGHSFDSPTVSLSNWNPLFLYKSSHSHDSYGGSSLVPLAFLQSFINQEASFLLLFSIIPIRLYCMHAYEPCFF